MRKIQVKRRTLCHSLLMMVVTMSAGCGSDGNPGVIPENKDPKAAREFIENTAGIKQKAKRGKTAELPPQPPK